MLWANGSSAIRSHVHFSSHTVSKDSPLDELIANTVLGTFWIVQGTSNMPFYAVGTNYSPTGNTLEGMQTPEYNATVGLYYLTLAILTFVYLICSIRTNVCLFLALFLLVITFSLFAGVFFQTALGHVAEAAKLQKVFDRHYYNLS